MALRILIVACLLASFSSKADVADTGQSFLDLGLNLRDDASAPPLQDGFGHLAPAILLVSTLDGTLAAVNQKDGSVQWRLNDQPAVKSPFDAERPSLPAFLPDPKDGSIYMIRSGTKGDPLTKLPFTIPELVANSPCRSNDGILYTGRKVDTWFSVDRATGSRKGAISFNGCSAFSKEDSCPTTSPGNFLIGRTEYSIMIYDSREKNGRSWNISFYDYSSNLGGSDHVATNYDMVHFTDSSTGSLLTLDRRTRSVAWDVPFKSPVVAMYLVQDEGIVKVPFTSMSKETIGRLLDKFDRPDGWSASSDMNDKMFFPTLYIGEHEHGLYAMPSFVDKQTFTISTHSDGTLLLAGPQSSTTTQRPTKDRLEEATTTVVSGSRKFDIPGIGEREETAVLLFGYYEVPHASKLTLHPGINRLKITAAGGRSEGGGGDEGGGSGHTKRTSRSRPRRPGDSFMPAGYPFILPDDGYHEEAEQQCSYNASRIHVGLEALRNLDISFVLSNQFIMFCLELIPLAKDNVSELENKELKVIAILMVILVMTVVKHIRVGADASFKLANSNGGVARMSSSVGSTHSSSHYETTAHPVELDDGTIRVGNIYFDPCNILGKGCEGTFVYKGTFDCRSVAVKRVLAACFSIADREVDLLRESDEHPNVIRYFCMEQDSQFRYIALEYCAATLQDLVEGKYVNETLEPLSILKQATQGLFHLHTLDICHRDIKPHNVLISMPGKKGEVRAMISDFGLCKKLKVGRMSFSRRSGVAGTEGWIAPEMMLGNRSTTCLVDIFSLGCVYYYVLSKGGHPFGESFRRQANILAGDFDLRKVEGDFVVESLIEKMIATEPCVRPPAGAVLKHPLFWSIEKKLTFLQDVSDLLEREDRDSAVVQAVERNRYIIANGNWYERLDEAVAQDLRQRRGYNYRSIRDLLRAVRNKKHHYQELSDDVKRIYGRIPDQFAEYWFSRFPRLFIHCWHAMHCVKTDRSFEKYFHKEYDFVVAPPMRRRTSNASPEQDEGFAPVSGWSPAAEETPLHRNPDGSERLFGSGMSSVVSRWEDRIASDSDDAPIPPEEKDAPSPLKDNEEFSSDYSNRSVESLELLQEEEVFEKCVGEEGEGKVCDNERGCSVVFDENRPLCTINEDECKKKGRKRKKKKKQKQMLQQQQQPVSTTA